MTPSPAADPVACGRRHEDPAAGRAPVREPAAHGEPAAYGWRAANFLTLRSPFDSK